MDDAWTDKELSRRSENSSSRLSQNVGCSVFGRTKWNSGRYIFTVGL